jgi:hypothetical protein
VVNGIVEIASQAKITNQNLFCLFFITKSQIAFLEISNLVDENLSLLISATFIDLLTSKTNIISIQLTFLISFFHEYFKSNTENKITIKDKTKKIYLI